MRSSTAALSGLGTSLLELLIGHHGGLKRPADQRRRPAAAAAAGPPAGGEPGATEAAAEVAGRTRDAEGAAEAAEAAGRDGDGASGAAARLHLQYGMLTRNYRSHASLLELPSRLFYQQVGAWGLCGGQAQGLLAELCCRRGCSTSRWAQEAGKLDSGGRPWLLGCFAAAVFYRQEGASSFPGVGAWRAGARADLGFSAAAATGSKQRVLIGSRPAAQHQALHACAPAEEVAPPSWRLTGAAGAGADGAAGTPKQPGSPGAGGPGAAHGGVNANEEAAAGAVRQQSVLFYGVRGQQQQDADAPSYHNPLEALAVVELLSSLLEAPARRAGAGLGERAGCAGGMRVGSGAAFVDASDPRAASSKRPSHTRAPAETTRTDMHACTRRPAPRRRPGVPPVGVLDVGVIATYRKQAIKIRGLLRERWAPVRGCVDV